MKLYQKRTAALQIANFLRYHAGFSFGEAQREAWEWINNQGCQLVTFVKRDGTVTTRAIALGQFSDYITFTGTGRPLPQGTKMMIEVAKVIAGKNPVITAKYDRIRSLIS